MYFVHKAIVFGNEWNCGNQLYDERGGGTISVNQEINM